MKPCSPDGNGQHSFFNPVWQNGNQAVRCECGEMIMRLGWRSPSFGPDWRWYLSSLKTEPVPPFSGFTRSLPKWFDRIEKDYVLQDHKKRRVEEAYSPTGAVMRAAGIDDLHPTATAATKFLMDQNPKLTKTIAGYFVKISGRLHDAGWNRRGLIAIIWAMKWDGTRRPQERPGPWEAFMRRADSEYTIEHFEITKAHKIKNGYPPDVSPDPLYSNEALLNFGGK